MSDITFLTDTLRVVTSTGTSIQLLEISAAGFVFGADLASDNFNAGVAGWLLTRDGDFELNSGIFRGTIAIGAGTNATLIDGTGLRVGDPAGGNIRLSDNGGLAPFINMRHAGDVYGSWGVTPTYSIAQLSDDAGNAVNLDGRGVITVFGPPGDVGLSIVNNADIIGDLTVFGVMRFGTVSALGGATVTGYVTIKDIGGTTRKLAVVSP